MKILAAGAHLTPAVATIEELQKYPDVEVVYVGRETTQEGDPSPSVESQVVPKLGIKYIPITAGRLQRSFTIYTIPSLLKIPIGFIQALYLILKEKPDVVLSFGGYVAVPVVFVGWLLSIPIIAHEQTLVSGLANKLSALFADKIALSFKGNRELNEKVIITGNPIRHMIIAQGIWGVRGKKNGKKLPTVLITGGNQGSHTINKTVEDCVEKLTGFARIIHITGDNKFKDFERLRKFGSLRKLGDRYIVKKWIGEEYGEVLQKVDLVVSRAGINTLTELAYLGKPALVIPIPYLYQDEQNINANFFSNLGLVNILPQSHLSASTLLDKVKKMLSHLNYLKEKAKNAKSMVIADAAKRLALETIILANH